MGASQSVPLCAYTISGRYDIVARCIYYFLLFCSLFFNHVEWLIPITLGPSMVFAAIAAVHAGILVFETGERATVDLDVLPVYAITSVAMMIAIPELLHSHTLRRTASSTRMVFFLWLVLTVAGCVASAIAIFKLPAKFNTSAGCDSAFEDQCNLVCNVSLPLRDGQTISTIWYHAVFLPKWVMVWCPLSLAFVIFSLGWDYARCGRRKREGWNPEVHGWRTLSTLVWTMLIVSNVGLMEWILNEPKGPPKIEKLITIGQLGPIVGLGFSVSAALVRWQFPAKEGEDKKRYIPINAHVRNRSSATTLVEPRNTWDGEIDQEDWKTSRERRASNYSS